MSRTSTVPYTPKASLELPEWEYAVHLLVDGKVTAVDGTVIAAYFQEQGSMLLFKDADHTVVDAFRADLVARVMRGDEPVDDA